MHYETDYSKCNVNTRELKLKFKSLALTLSLAVYLCARYIKFMNAIIHGICNKASQNDSESAATFLQMSKFVGNRVTYSVWCWVLTTATEKERISNQVAFSLPTPLRTWCRWLIRGACWFTSWHTRTHWCAHPQAKRRRKPSGAKLCEHKVNDHPSKTLLVAPARRLEETRS